MKVVLVTGAGGFIGGAVAHALVQDGYAVRALIRSSSGKTSCPAVANVVIGDLQDLGAMKRAVAGVEAIVHLAGKAHALDDPGGHDEQYEQVNVEGTKHLLKAAEAERVSRIIFASSVKVFGETTDGCVDESVRANPATAYARSKWQAEQLLSDYARRTGAVAVSLRLSMVYGPTEKGNLFRMMSAIDQGRFPPLPNIDNKRSLVHVSNVVQAIRCCLRQERTRLPAYIVADASPYSTTQLYDSLCKGLGRARPSWRLPLSLLKAGAWFGDLIQKGTGRSVPLTTRTLEKLFESAWYSPAALMRDVGYSPSLSFDDAVPELVAFYRKSITRC
ncbi:NAD-dependent epimerase/dehydratase family protein [Petrachloros mirabilis]